MDSTVQGLIAGFSMLVSLISSTDIFAHSQHLQSTLPHHRPKAEMMTMIG
jgi:hypothetical protein